MPSQSRWNPDAARTFWRGGFVTSRARFTACLSGVLLSTQVVPASHAARVSVGPQGTYATVEAAINGNTWAAGDTIEIAAGTFNVQSMLQPRGSGQAGAPIVVRGAGMGLTIVSGAALSNAKALWDVEQNNRWWVFEDMTVSGMRGAQTNARGFFLVGCEDVVLQRLEITDCWNGIMSASGSKRVTLQYSNVHHCGGLAGPAHNIYMNSGEDFLIQHNWLHESQYGMCYKDRTHNLTFRYNWVENADVEGYEVSLAGDGSGDQGETLLLGNVIVKSPSSANQSHFIRFEDGRVGTLRLVHNTLVARPSTVVVSSIATLTTLDNNLVVDGKSLSGSGSWSGGHNWFDSGLQVPVGLVGDVRGTDPGLIAGYRLGGASPCLDAGATVAPAPQYQWGQFGSPELRAPVGVAPDIGAFELLQGGGTPVTPIQWGAFKARYREPLSDTGS